MQLKKRRENSSVSKQLSSKLKLYQLLKTKIVIGKKLRDYVNVVKKLQLKSNLRKKLRYHEAVFWQLKITSQYHLIKWQISFIKGIIIMQIYSCKIFKLLQRTRSKLGVVIGSLKLTVRMFFFKQVKQSIKSIKNLKQNGLHFTIIV